MIENTNILDFIKLSETIPVLDVRTPAEFEQGHIPGAINFSLFNNEERKIIGTIYKQEGKQKAILKGLECVGPRMKQMIENVNFILANHQSSITNHQSILVHCWRGGMRSSSVAWLLSMYGFKCYTLKGGYKAYRKSVLQSFMEHKNFIVLSGKTGSGKTIVLHELQKQREQIIDLENLAHHKGSSFGAFGEEKQLSQEQFENELSHQLSKVNPEKVCWIEDESRKIGINVLPENLWNQMRNTSVVCLNIKIEERVNYLVTEYGKFTNAEIINAINRIGKKLGGLFTKQAVEAVQASDLKTACEITLRYYDKSYEFGINQRQQTKITQMNFEKLDVAEIVQKLIQSI